MLWREPAYFWLVLVVAGVAVGLLVALRGRAAAIARFADVDLGQRLAVGTSMARRWLRASLRVLALALICLALAGPKWGFHWEEVRREGIDLLVALDTSRSMLATDVKPNRLERAKLAVLDLLPRLRGDRIGLVAYAGTAFLETPLTLDYTAFSRSMRALNVGIIPRGGTSLSRAIETSLQAFEARQGKYEALILITDGEDHEGDALEAAVQAKERGVKIYTVGIGTPDGELVPLQGQAAGYVKDRKGQVVKSRLNEDLLRDIALDTGGAYVRGLGPQLGLDEVFDEHIAKMERREVDSGLERRYEERFQLPLAVAMVLLLIEAVLGERRRRFPLGLSRLASRFGWAAQSLLCVVLIGAGVPAEAGVFDFEEDPINQGVDSFAAGDYEAAVDKFGEALVESPASPLLQFDLAAALYKQGRYEDAIATLEKVASEGGADWAISSNYNLGNAYFRAGAEVEQEQPQQSLERWSQALLAYRRAMAADPSDVDVKYNHELVQKRIDELKERLEQEQQEQEQEEQQQDDQQQEQDDRQQQDEQQQEQNEEQQQDDQQQQDEQQQDDQQEQQPQQDSQESQEPQDSQDDADDQQQAGGEEEQEEQPEEQDSQGSAEDDEEPQEAPSEQPPEAAEGSAGERDEERQAAEQAARAVLDTARSEELGPQDIQRPVGAAGIGDPRRDW